MDDTCNVKIEDGTCNVKVEDEVLNDFTGNECYMTYPSPTLGYVSGGNESEIKVKCEDNNSLLQDIKSESIADSNFLQQDIKSEAHPSFHATVVGSGISIGGDTDVKRETLSPSCSVVLRRLNKCPVRCDTYRITSGSLHCAHSIPDTEASEDSLQLDSSGVDDIDTSSIHSDSIKEPEAVQTSNGESEVLEAPINEENNHNRNKKRCRTGKGKKEKKTFSNNHSMKESMHKSETSSQLDIDHTEPKRMMTLKELFEVVNDSGTLMYRCLMCDNSRIRQFTSGSHMRRHIKHFHHPLDIRGIPEVPRWTAFEGRDSEWYSVRSGEVVRNPGGDETAPGDRCQELIKACAVMRMARSRQDDRLGGSYSESRFEVPKEKEERAVRFTKEAVEEMLRDAQVEEGMRKELMQKYVEASRKRGSGRDMTSGAKDKVEIEQKNKVGVSHEARVVSGVTTSSVEKTGDKPAKVGSCSELRRRRRATEGQTTEESQGNGKKKKEDTRSSGKGDHSKNSRDRSNRLQNADATGRERVGGETTELMSGILGFRLKSVLRKGCYPMVGEGVRLEPQSKAGENAPKAGGSKKSERTAAESVSSSSWAKVCHPQGVIRIPSESGWIKPHDVVAYQRVEEQAPEAPSVAEMDCGEMQSLSPMLSAGNVSSDGRPKTQVTRRVGQVKSDLTQVEHREDPYRRMGRSPPGACEALIFYVLVSIAEEMRIPLCPRRLLDRGLRLLPGVPRSTVGRTARMVLAGMRLGARAIRREIWLRTDSRMVDVHLNGVLDDIEETPLSDESFWDE